MMEQNEQMTINYDIKGKKGMKRAGLFFFLLMIIEIPMSIVVRKVQDLFPAEKGTLVSVLVTQGYLLLSAIIYMIVTGKSFTKDLNIKKYKVSSFFLSLVLLMCASPMANWLNVLSQFFAKNQTGQAIFEITENVPIWLGILIIGCLPGFVEETIYRGIMYTAFSKYSVLVGVIVSALSFGLMHLNFNQMLYAIYLGTVFALLVEATGSLLSTMILHMLFNAVNTMYLYLLPKLFEFAKQFGVSDSWLNMEEMMNKTPTTMELVSALMVFTPLAGVGIVLSVLLLKKIAQINGRTLTWKSISEKKEVLENKEPVNIWLILGWIICLIFCVINMLF